MVHAIVCRSAAAALAFLVTAAAVEAAENAAQTRQANPAGGGANWSTQVAPTTSQPASPYDEGAAEHIQRVNAYFNSMVHLQGRFVQVDPNNERTSGRFYVQRPGKLRFDYAPPSKMRIVSDGTYLTIEDHDLNTVDKFPLDATPFRLLLVPQVDLLRDARIVEFRALQGMISLTLEDKSGESGGQMKLFFAAPQIELKEWIITDPQGLNTHIQVADLEKGKEIAAKFFDTTTVAFPTFSE